MAKGCGQAPTASQENFPIALGLPPSVQVTSATGSVMDPLEAKLLGPNVLQVSASIRLKPQSQNPLCREVKSHKGNSSEGWNMQQVETLVSGSFFPGCV